MIMEMVTEKKMGLGIWVSILTLFLLNPTAALLVGIYMALYASNLREDKGKIMVFFFMLSFWLASINITKTPASDQGAYIGIFVRSPLRGFYKTAFETLGNGSGKEFMYGVYTWVIYNLCLGSTVMFFFWTTVIENNGEY